MLKTNYHTHTKYCHHAEGDVIDYVKKASDLGFIELGMSDHAPILKSFMTEKEYKDNWCDTSCMSQELVDDYITQIKEARLLFPNMKIYSGFETEFLKEEIDFYKELRKKVDYFNLGLHFIKDKNGNVLNSYFDLNYSNIDEYVNTLEEALKTGMYTTFVHPDLFMYKYKDKNGNHTFDEKCVDVTKRIIELALKYDIYLEVNTNGLKYCKNKNDRNTWLYPYPDFWLIVKEYPVKILIGADCHTPDSLNNENVRLVLDFVKEIGLNIEEKMVIK